MSDPALATGTSGKSPTVAGCVLDIDRSGILVAHVIQFLQNSPTPAVKKYPPVILMNSTWGWRVSCSINGVVILNCLSVWSNRNVSGIRRT